MQVKIEAILDREKHNACKAAYDAYTDAHNEHRIAENDAFMALMTQIGVKVGDKVKITHNRGWGSNGEAILVGPKRFAKIKKDGTASRFEFQTYAPYNVEKA